MVSTLGWVVHRLEVYLSACLSAYLSVLVDQRVDNPLLLLLQAQMVRDYWVLLVLWLMVDNQLELVNLVEQRLQGIVHQYRIVMDSYGLMEHCVKKNGMYEMNCHPVDVFAQILRKIEHTLKTFEKIST